MSASVSIIIPVYNVEKYLRKCLDSVINQSIKSKEIIVVNDGSTDSSLSIINEYKAKYPDIIIVDKKNGGLASARNAGLKVARGEYIGFVDSDDYIHIDMYENLYNKAKQNNSDIVMCGHLRIFNDHEESFVYDYNENKVYNSEEITKEFLKHAISLSSCDKLFKRELFEKHDFFFPEGKLNEDIQVVFGLIFNSDRICFDNKPYYHYYQRGGSITKKIRINSVLDMISAIENIRMQLEEKGQYAYYKDFYKSFYYSYIGTSNMMFYEYFYGHGLTEEAKSCKELLDSHNNNIRLMEVFRNKVIDKKNRVKILLLKLKLLKLIVIIKLKIKNKNINN